MGEAIPAGRSWPGMSPVIFAHFFVRWTGGAPGGRHTSVWACGGGGGLAPPRVLEGGDGAVVDRRDRPFESGCMMVRRDRRGEQRPGRVWAARSPRKPLRPPYRYSSPCTASHRRGALLPAPAPDGVFGQEDLPVGVLPSHAARQQPSLPGGLTGVGSSGRTLQVVWTPLPE
jgi:hypothetical protein